MAASQPPDSTAGFMLRQDDEDRDRRARILVGGPLTMSVLVARAAFFRHLLSPVPLALLVPLGSAVLILGAAPLLHRFLGLTTTGIVVPVTITAAIGSVAYSQAGLGTPVATALALPPLIATLFGGRRAGAGVAALSGLVLYWLYALKVNGHVFLGMRMDGTQLARARLNVLGVVVAIAAAIAWLYEHERVRRETRLREVQARYELAVEGSACDLRQLLDETLALNAGLEEKHGVKLELAADASDATVQLDRGHIQQVLTNLVSNACKFAPAGTAVTVGAAPTPDELRMHVSDHGPGVPAGFETRLFQRFAQADGSAVRAHPGTGLGLYISRRIVESHGGRIAYRREDAASVFEVTLPIAGRAEDES